MLEGLFFVVISHYLEYGGLRVVAGGLSEVYLVR